MNGIEENVTGYIVGRALTKGVEQVSGAVSSCGTLVASVQHRHWQYSVYYRKGEWFRTPEEAAEACRVLRDKRIASLKRSLERAEKTTVEHMMRNVN